MPCFHPLDAWRMAVDGRIVFHEAPGVLSAKLQLPCGQCIGCRLERSRQWAIRCVHEAQMHEESIFCTLTYDPEHYPDRGSLNYRDFQLFMKRLRVAYGRPVRFYGCGEYGELNGRPHFHACLFGLKLSDRVFRSTSPSGFKLYTSEFLSRLWPMGDVSFGDVTFESAAYAARYVVKKVNGDAADEHYRRIDPVTGEVYQLEPEFSMMSLKPGIGATWFSKFQLDCLPRDECIIRGKVMKVPKYYSKLLKRMDAELYADVETGRFLKHEDYMKSNAGEVLPTLEAKEVVAYASLNSKLRNKV